MAKQIEAGERYCYWTIIKAGFRIAPLPGNRKLGARSQSGVLIRCDCGNFSMVSEQSIKQRELRRSCGCVEHAVRAA